MRSGWSCLLAAAAAIATIGCANREEKVSCKDAPLLTYNNFGKSFIDFNCQGCHGSQVEGEFRRGAPAEFAFDTVDDVWKHAEFILATSTGEDPIMPPSGGVFADDELRLQLWLTCTPEGN
jgi:uncharacterized membrane protein